MQRPRCLYFRDVTAACNRRSPGAGCAVIGGRNRTHAILGTSTACAATHPSDLAVALTALDALVITRDRSGEHPIRIAEFFRQPGDTPEREHNLSPGALITAIEVPVRPNTRRSGYLKVRDRSSYEFALTSAAVPLDISGGIVRSARIAVGGVGRGDSPPSKADSSATDLTHDSGPPPQPSTAHNRCRRMASRSNCSNAPCNANSPPSQACHDPPTGHPTPLPGKPSPASTAGSRSPGAARYAADNPVPDHLHAALVCSTVARAAIDAINTKAATGQRDVIQVITDFSGVTLPFDITRVSFFGQPLAIVVANMLEAATHAAALVVVRYREEPQHTDFDDPAAIREPSKSGPDYARGDADAALRTSPAVVDRTYTIARNYHNPTEIPATIAAWDGDQLTVWDKVQGIHYSQQALQRRVRRLCRQHPRHLTVRRRRVRQRRRNLAAPIPRRSRSPADAPPGQTRADPAANVCRLCYRPNSRQRPALGADRTGRFTTTIHESQVEVSRYGSYEDFPHQRHKTALRLTGLPYRGAHRPPRRG
jgi:hypothetical protein